MSETVNDYHGYSRKNQTCSTPLKKKKIKSAGKPQPDVLKSEFSRRVTQQSQSGQAGLEDDNSSFGAPHERELYKMDFEPVDGDEVDASNDDMAATQMPEEDRQEIKLPKIDSAYFDLIKAGRRDQITLEPEDVDHDLIADLAKSLSCRDQIPVPGFENDAGADRLQNQSVFTDHLKNSHTAGLWTRRVKFGSAAMLAAGVLAVLLVNSQELPGGSEGNIEVALASTLTGLNADPVAPDPVTMEKPPAISLSSAEVKNSEASSVTRFVPVPVPVNVSETTSQPDSLSISQADVERALKLETLTKNLKIVRAYLSSRQLAYSDAALEDKPKVLEEVIKIKSELTSLIERINTLQSPAKIALPTEIAGITPALGKIEKATLAAIPEGDSDGVDVAVVQPAASLKIRKTRNPAKVELALAAMPGLYRLPSGGRSRLKSKLINGECLVPALSSVFPQVPALVMRDMIRQFEGQC